MKNLKQTIFNWLFKEQLEEIEKLKKQMDESAFRVAGYADNAIKAMNLCEKQEKVLRNTVGDIQVATDIHLKSPSWAVICIQGQRADFVKFIDLDQRDIEGIAHYLRRFERRNVIADMPYCIPKNQFFRID
jgi:hypothetical protein